MGKKVLIIDDEKDIRDSLKIILEKEGYDVSEAENGKLGIALATKELFDLVLLDVMMPEVSGWDVFTEVMKKNPDYKHRIMFLSVVDISDERKKELYSKGLGGYMTKPFEIDRLLENIKKIIK